ncbi:glycoside hydrolase 5 family protein [Paenibacillus albus]|uniref:beta-galactosidase n=1 Tax=Paenibacillus albus TaxID=2495582 RepID=UPI0013DEA460|nr:beta-galactosidase [Paenibacillus albus]
MRNRRRLLVLAIATLVLLLAVVATPVIQHWQSGSDASEAIDPHELGFNTQEPYFAQEDELNRLYDQVRSTGTQWVRVTLFWDLMEQVKGSIDWTQADLILDTAAAKGLKVVLVIRSAPSWAADGADTSLHNYMPTDGEAYGLFCYEVTKRYLKSAVPLVFELGNEENMQFFNMPEVDAAKYTTTMLIPGSEGIRRAAKELGAVRPLVLVGGFAPVEPTYVPNSVRPLDFMKAIYDNGGRGYFDSIAYHPYTYESEPSSSHWTFSELASLVDLMNSYGDMQRKIWATEVGFATGSGEGEVSEEDQAEFTGAAVDVWYSLPYAGPMLWYELVDNTSDDDANRENRFGLLHSDANWTPKPAYDVLVEKIRSFHVK